jgi:hypothetical protein
MQSGREWLLKLHKQGPRPELASVGMAGKLQIKARFCRGGRGARLVCQENFDTRVCRRTRERSLRIASLRRIK